MRYQLRIRGDGKYEVVDTQTGQARASTSVDVAQQIQAQLTADYALSLRR